MGAGVMPAGLAVRSHTAKSPETEASGAENGARKGSNPCQNQKNPSNYRVTRPVVSNRPVVQQPVSQPPLQFRGYLWTSSAGIPGFLGTWRRRIRPPGYQVARFEQPTIPLVEIPQLSPFPDTLIGSFQVHWVWAKLGCGSARNRVAGLRGSGVVTPGVTG